jgi:uncharacterized membrane protein
MAFEEQIIEALSFLPPWLTTVIIAMLPVIELRGSIPIAIGYFSMDPVESYILSVIGNMIPVPFILWLLGPVERLIRATGLFEKTFNRFSDSAVRRTSRSIEAYKFLGLAVFVAIPLPMTGAWTASLAAYILRTNKKDAIPAIFLGVIIAGVIVTLASMGILSVWGI